MRKFRVALVQMDSREDVNENLGKIEMRVKEAAEGGAYLVVFPEHVNYIGPDHPGHAVDVPGPICDFFARLARKYHLWIHGGTVAEKREGKSGNLTMVFDPEGEQRAEYRKIHMFDIDVPGVEYRESDTIEPGRELVTVETDAATLGLTVCYDLRFPGQYARLADLGAEVLINCANFTDTTGALHWEPLLRARAIENTCFVLACGQCGDKFNTRSHGNSMVIDPWGRIIARAGSEETILFADLDPTLLTTAREQIPCLKNRRRDLCDA